MVIGRLSCGRSAPGSGRVVVVRSLRSWLPTREGPLEPLSWHRRLLARLLARKAFSSLLEGSRGGAASKRLRRRATSGKPHDPCLFRRGLPNQTTARGKAPRTHEDPSRRGGLPEPEAANGPWKKQFFLRLFCSPPRHASAGSELYHRVCNEPFDAVMVSVMVPALGMRDVHLRARLKIWEPFLDSPDQHGLR